MSADSNPIVLRSERLLVEIARPGTAYAGTRFDWTGFVTQVTLDGRHRYCVPEDFGKWKSTGGIGLCNEFGIDAPIGYAEASPGECYPKLGIGLLRRPESTTYRFGTPHEIVQHFPMTMTVRDAGVRFEVEPVDCRGYAARLVKTLTVRGAELELAYQLENTGSRPLNTNEYNHNFVGFNGKSIGPDYELAFPRPVTVVGAPETAAILEPRADRLGWRAVPAESFHCQLPGAEASTQPQWDLCHHPSGAAMSETVSFAPSRVALWGTGHTACVEVFIDINLAPGASMEWTRRYAFRG